MGTLFRLGRDAVTPAAGTRVLKASEASLLLEAQTLLDAARERAAVQEVLGPGEWNVFGGHGANQIVTVP